MILRSKKKAKPFEGPDFDVLIQRAQILGTSEAVEALEVSLNSISRYVSEYRRTRDVTLLEEMKMSAEAFYVLADELAGRHIDGYDVAPARQRREHY